MNPNTEQRLIQMMGDPWFLRLRDLLSSEYMRCLGVFLKRKRVTSTIYPQEQDVFRAFRLTPYEQVSVVILGQDPYPNSSGEADGLAFSSGKPLVYPSSLREMHRELERQFDSGLGLDRTSEYSLEGWAKQGVLLLNTALTVVEQAPGSHSEIWEPFMVRVFEELNRHPDRLIFLLWGNDARAYKKEISSYHQVYEAEHPAACVHRRPYNPSSIWNSNNCFFEANKQLAFLGRKPINW